MTSYSVADIKKDVRIAMDQNALCQQLLDTSDIDTLTVDEIIESKIEDAARSIETSCPLAMLESGSTLSTTTTIKWSTASPFWGYVTLPSDFMRLLAFKMSDWERTVFVAVSPTSDTYRMQSSRLKGIRGNTQKPVCALVPASGGWRLEFYSCKTATATISLSQYIKTPKIAGGNIDISEKCYRPVIYYAAGLAAQAMGMETANSFFEIAKSFLTENEQ